MIKAIHHIGISVADLGGAERFYRDLLDMEVASRRTFESTQPDDLLGPAGAMGAATVLAAADLRIELFQYSRPAPVRADSPRAFGDVGLSHFCITVSDIEHAHERLCARGTAFNCPPLEIPGTANKVVAGRDAGGNLFELVQRGARRAGPAIKALDHVAISVASIERSTAFYRDLLGMPVTIDRAFAGDLYERITGLPGARGNLVFLQAGTMRFELLEFAHPSARPGDPRRPLCDHGISHFCLEVADLDAECSRLAAAGISLYRSALDSHGKAKALYARDPDGNVIELI